MEKPTYRLEKIDSSTPARILMGSNIRKSTLNIEDKTFCFFNRSKPCEVTCQCDDDMCVGHNVNFSGDNCGCDSGCRINSCSCQKDFSGYKCDCNPQCNCVGYNSCSCESDCGDHCQHCPCVGN
jgi:hypothetical protein